MKQDILDLIQEKIGYEFHNPALLEQAFTRKTYAQEHRSTFHNEVLEFYGDKALEFVVMKRLSGRYGTLTEEGFYRSIKSEGELTRIKSEIVRGSALAKELDELGVSAFLQVGRGDEMAGLKDRPAVKEDLFESIIGAVALDCGWDVATIEHVLDRMDATVNWIDDECEA